MNRLLLIILFICVGYICNAQTITEEPRQYIGILRLSEYYQIDSNWTEADGNIVGQHFLRLQQLAAESKVILAGRMDLVGNDPNMIGIVIIATTTRDEAEKIMFEDPAVIHEIMTAILFPFDVAVQSTKH